MNGLRLREMNESDVGRISIGHHTYKHDTVGARTREELVWQAEKGYEIFHKNGVYPKHIAYPGGNHDYNALNVLQDYFESGTTTGSILNDYSLNPMRVHRYGLDDKTMTEIKAIIDNAVSTGGWLLTYQHGLSETGMSLGGYQIQTPANQLEIIQYAKSLGVEIVSLEKGLEMYAPYQYIMDNDSYDPVFAVRRNGTVYTKS